MLQCYCLPVCVCWHGINWNLLLKRRRRDWAIVWPSIGWQKTNTYFQCPPLGQNTSKFPFSTPLSFSKHRRLFSIFIFKNLSLKNVYTFIVVNNWLTRSVIYRGRNNYIWLAPRVKTKSLSPTILCLLHICQPMSPTALPDTSLPVYFPLPRGGPNLLL